MEQQLRPVQYNTTTHRRTNRQFLFVVIPMVLLFIVVIALTYLAGSRSEAIAGRTVFSQIATIALIVPTLLFCLVPLALNAVLIFAVVWLTRKLPPLFFRAHHVLIRMSQTVDRIGQAVAGTLIKAHAAIAWVSHLYQGLRAPRRIGRARP